MKVAKIGNKEIGPKKKLFITFECGPTHTGFESAKKLIRKLQNQMLTQLNFKYLDRRIYFQIKNIRLIIRSLTKKIN